MTQTWRIGRLYLMGQGSVMLALGTALFVLGSFMANPVFDEFGYVIAVLLVALCLLMNGVYHGILANRARPDRLIANYLIPCTLSIACWLIFWLVQSAPVDIRLLDLLAGMQGLFWAIWYLRLAFNLRANYKKPVLLSVLAATTSYLGILLATQSHLSKLSSVTEVACYTAFTGVQLLLTAIYLFRESAVEREPLPARIHIGSAIRTTDNSIILLTK